MKVATLMAWVDALGAPRPTIADAHALLGPEIGRDDAREEVLIAPSDPPATEVVVELDGDEPGAWAGVRHAFDPPEPIDVPQLETWLGPPSDPGPIVDAFDARPRRMQYLVRRGDVEVTVIATPVSIDDDVAQLGNVIVRRVPPWGSDDDAAGDEEPDDVR